MRCATAWRLEQRLDGDDKNASADWQLLASGSGPVSGRWGQINLTKMLNGIYALRLRAITSDG